METEREKTIQSQIDWESIEKKYPQQVSEKLALVPTNPGCYLMKNSLGKVIYVGKAKILRNRVRSYFQKGASLTRQKRRMVYEVANIEWIVTDSELEALILENNLIKKYHPQYNVMMRDDKSYPYIAITMGEDWPRVIFKRKLRLQPKETDKYYGPYTDVLAVRETLKIIRRVFKVPCGYKNPESSKGRACMYYHINQCLGPCCGKVTKKEYLDSIKKVMTFLEGRNEPLIEELLQEMETASENLEFEKAAKIRDQISSIQKLVARQKVISTNLADQDVIALVTDNCNAIAEIFFVRGGKLIGQEHFILDNTSSDEIGEGLKQFILQYYENAPYLPKEILVSSDIEEMDIIEAWLRQKKGQKVELQTPKRGEKKQLVDMASKNADLVLKQLKSKMESDCKIVASELESLQKAINSPILPRRIEAYDISNISGHFTVASLVVFVNGKADKNLYRRFKINLSEGKPDDFASMREVLARRLTGSLRKSNAFKVLPDLMLIDGGKGQLSSALEIIEGLEYEVPVIGLAKQNEEIYLPHKQEPVRLEKKSGALHLIQRIRDEAHRFAISYHRKIRGKTMRISILNEIPNVGPKRRKALLKHLGSLTAIKNATIEELLSVPGINKNAAEAIYNFFKSKQENNDAE
ncbi:MAG: excinuclease ABC subunit UvrC [Armatimonadota bacterium]